MAQYIMLARFALMDEMKQAVIGMKAEGAAKRRGLEQDGYVVTDEQVYCTPSPDAACPIGTVTWQAEYGKAG